jgi:hypothetical protein
MKYLTASGEVSSSPLWSRHFVPDTACPVLDTEESSLLFWIPAFAGMTTSRRAAGNGPIEIQAQNRENTSPGTKGTEKTTFSKSAPAREIELGWIFHWGKSYQTMVVVLHALS